MHIQDLFPSAVFVCNAGRRAVWELKNMKQAEKAISELGAEPYNWAPFNGMPAPINGAKPKVSISF